MKKFLLYTLSVVLTLVFTACNRHLNIEKRRYRPGFYVNLSKPVSGKPETVSDEKKSMSITDRRVYSHVCENSSTYNSPIKHEPVPVFSNENPELPVKSSEKQYKRPVQPESYTKSEEKVSNLQPMPVGVWKNNGNVSTRRQAKNRLKTDGSRMSDYIFLSITGLFTFLTVFGCRKRIQRPAKLSYWAKKNKIKTMFLINAIIMAIIPLGFQLGHILSKLSVSSTHTSTIALTAVLTFITAIFPVKGVKKGILKYSGKKHRLFALLFTLTSFGIFVNLGNRHANGDYKMHSTLEKAFHTSKQDHSAELLNLSDTGDFIPNKKYETKELIVNILVSILIIAVALGLSILLLILICELSCAGHYVAAVAVGIAGFTGIILLIYFTMKALWKPRNDFYIPK